VSAGRVTHPKSVSGTNPGEQNMHGQSVGHPAGQPGGRSDAGAAGGRSGAGPECWQHGQRRAPRSWPSPEHSEAAGRTRCSTDAKTTQHGVCACSVAKTSSSRTRAGFIFASPPCGIYQRVPSTAIANVAPACDPTCDCPPGRTLSQLTQPRTIRRPTLSPTQRRQNWSA
jgi:hypothetical protein